MLVGVDIASSVNDIDRPAHTHTQLPCIGDIDTHTQVQAVDEDFGDYGTSTYDIFSDQMRDYFAIDKVKGEITTKVRLDREERRSYDVPVIATDGGGRSGFCSVRVKVGDLNDNAPAFHLHEYKVAIYGNATVNGTFLKVSVAQRDDGVDGIMCTYESGDPDV